MLDGALCQLREGKSSSLISLPDFLSPLTGKNKQTNKQTTKYSHQGQGLMEIDMPLVITVPFQHIWEVKWNSNHTFNNCLSLLMIFMVALVGNNQAETSQFLNSF